MKTLSANNSCSEIILAKKYRLQLYLWLGIAATILIQLGVRFSGHLSHDVAWYVLSVNRLLDGAILYQDIFEVNPPLAFWLMTPPVAFHRLTGIDSIQSVYMYICFLILCSAFMVNRILALRLEMANTHRALFVWLIVLCCAFIPASDFAQREHIMVILLLPYLVLSAVRLDNGRLTATLPFFIGVVAAIGLCLKPQMMAIPLAAELYIITRKRNVSRILRPETIAIATITFVYLGLVLVVTPDYLSNIVPMAMETYSSTYRLATSTFTGRINAVTIGFLLVLLAKFLIVDKDTLTGIFLAATVGAVISYTVQFKGFRYHMVPAYVLIVLASGTLLLTAIFQTVGNNELLKRSSFRINIAVTILSVVFTAGVSSAWLHRHYKVNKTISDLLEQHAPYTRSVFVATAHPSIAFPAVVERNLVWASRYPAQWLIPGIAIARHNAYENDDISLRLHDIEEFARGTAVEDFLHFEPDLVLFDVRERKNYFGVAKFDYLEFYKEDKRFVKLWAHYEPFLETAHMSIYLRNKTKSDNNQNNK